MDDRPDDDRIIKDDGTIAEIPADESLEMNAAKRLPSDAMGDAADDEEIDEDLADMYEEDDDLEDDMELE